MSAPETYFDSIAEFYDAVNPIEHDIEFWVDQARDADGAVLEIGCGTGRVYLELLRADVDAYGIDVSQEMVDVLGDKASAAGLQPRVSKADMRTFDLGTTFDLVLVPLRTFMSAVTLDDQRETLTRIKEHLEPDGTMIVDFPTMSPETIAETYGVEREHPVRIGGDEYTQVMETEFIDMVEETIRAERRLYETNGELVVEAEQRSKLVRKREFELLLELVGFSDWEVYSGYQLEKPKPSEPNQELVWIVDR